MLLWKISDHIFADLINLGCDGILIEQKKQSPDVVIFQQAIYFRLDVTVRIRQPFEFYKSIGDSGSYSQIVNSCMLWMRVIS